MKSISMWYCISCSITKSWHLIINPHTFEGGGVDKYSKSKYISILYSNTKLHIPNFYTLWVCWYKLCIYFICAFMHMGSSITSSGKPEGSTTIQNTKPSSATSNTTSETQSTRTTVTPLTTRKTSSDNTPTSKPSTGPIGKNYH